MQGFYIISLRSLAVIYSLTPKNKTLHTFSSSLGQLNGVSQGRIIKFKYFYRKSKKVSEVRRGVLWAWEKIKMERDDGGQVWQWGARTGLLNEDN